MKRPRRTARIVVFVLLVVAGAIVNVAVAWGFAAFCEQAMDITSEMDSDAADDARAYWKVHAPDDWSGHVPFWWLQVDGLGVRQYSEFAYGDRGSVLAMGHADAGWPCLTLRAFSTWVVGQSAERGTLRWGLKLTAPWIKRALPLRPIWPGFAINTVFYAAVLWMLFAFPFAMRRRMRIKRGLCPKCAYDLRGQRGGPADSKTCPECGAVGTPR